MFSKEYKREFTNKIINILREVGFKTDYTIGYIPGTQPKPHPSVQNYMDDLKTEVKNSSNSNHNTAPVPLCTNELKYRKIVDQYSSKMNGNIGPDLPKLLPENVSPSKVRAITKQVINLDDWTRLDATLLFYKNNGVAPLIQKIIKKKNTEPIDSLLADFMRKDYSVELKIEEEESTTILEHLEPKDLTENLIIEHIFKLIKVTDIPSFKGVITPILYKYIKDKVFNDTKTSLIDKLIIFFETLRRFDPNLSISKPITNSKSLVDIVQSLLTDSYLEKVSSSKKGLLDVERSLKINQNYIDEVTSTDKQLLLFTVPIDTVLQVVSDPSIVENVLGLDPSISSYIILGVIIDKNDYKTLFKEEHVLSRNYLYCVEDNTLQVNNPDFKLIEEVIEHLFFNKDKTQPYKCFYLLEKDNAANSNTNNDPYDQLLKGANQDLSDQLLLEGVDSIVDFRKKNLEVLFEHVVPYKSNFIKELKLEDKEEPQGLFYHKIFEVLNIVMHLLFNEEYQDRLCSYINSITKISYRKLPVGTGAFKPELLYHLLQEIYPLKDEYERRKSADRSLYLNRARFFKFQFLEKCYEGNIRLSPSLTEPALQRKVDSLIKSIAQKPEELDKSITQSLHALLLSKKHNMFVGKLVEDKVCNPVSSILFSFTRLYERKHESFLNRSLEDGNQWDGGTLTHKKSCYIKPTLFRNKYIRLKKEPSTPPTIVGYFVYKVGPFLNQIMDDLGKHTISLQNVNESLRQRLLNVDRNEEIKEHFYNLNELFTPIRFPHNVTPENKSFLLSSKEQKKLKKIIEIFRKYNDESRELNEKLYVQRNDYHIVYTDKYDLRFFADGMMNNVDREEIPEHVESLADHKQVITAYNDCISPNYSSYLGKTVFSRKVYEIIQGESKTPLPQLSKVINNRNYMEVVHGEGFGIVPKQGRTLSFEVPLDKTVINKGFARFFKYDAYKGHEAFSGVIVGLSNTKNRGSERLYTLEEPFSIIKSRFFAFFLE